MSTFEIGPLWPDQPMDSNRGGEKSSLADFEDVTDILREAGQDMDPGTFIFTEEFTLQDAMSVVEIGEPRLDSGVIEDSRPPFDPLSPLLPEELCWILDRSFAYEMEWHAGNTLSQTVFTFLPIHRLDDINPEFIPHVSVTTKSDGFRPLELNTVVLRSAAMGLLKCCNLAWIELSNGVICGGEDWQSEKCEISLLEGVPVKFVLAKLEDAIIWLRASPKAPGCWRKALLARISLRKILLQLMDHDIFKDVAEFHELISTARDHLGVIRTTPSPIPMPDSPAHLFFDPYIARRLNASIPLRVVQPRTPERTWEAIEALLDGWEEIQCLSTSTDISTWLTLGYLRLWSPKPLHRIPYLRAITQSVFFHGVFILNRFPFAWLADRFFLETLGYSYKALVEIIHVRWAGNSSPPFAGLEQRVSRLILSYIQALWYNQPRCRRYLAKSLVDWHALYDALVNITSQLTPYHKDDADIITQIPNAVLVWRLTILREVIFSGFQLELYTADEKVFAYWYASQVIERHLSCLNKMLAAVSQGSAAGDEMRFQHGFLSALQLMSKAMFSSTVRLLSLSLQRMRLNVLRRYKWAFRPEYDEIDSPDVGAPEYSDFLLACGAIMKDECYSPSDSMKSARQILTRLRDGSVGWGGHWGEDRKNFIDNLANSCEQLSSLPANMKDNLSFDLALLKWDPHVNPWFPSLTTDAVVDRGE